MRARSTPDIQRHHILVAARQTFADHGFAKTNIADIAQNAGINRTLLYHYFHDKDEILLHLLLDALDQVEQLISRVRHASGTSSEQIRLLIDGYFELMEAQPGLAQLLVDAGAVRQGPAIPEYYAGIARLQAALLEWATDVNAGGPTGDHAKQFLLVALGALFIWFLPTPFAQALAGATPQSAEQYREVLHQVLVNWAGP